MARRFWFLSLIWTMLVIALTPALIEVLDRRGWAVTLPGLTVTASEIVLAGSVALAGITVLWLLLRPRKVSR